MTTTPTAKPKPKPVLFLWREDDVMVPSKRDLALAQEQYEHGKTYFLKPNTRRSEESHDQFFAVLRHAFLNLPENVKDLYPTELHLRKRTLIAAGFCKQKTTICKTSDEALRHAAMIEFLDIYALINVSGPIVDVFIAESMKVDEDHSRDGMDAKRFQEAKEACFEIWATLIGVTVKELTEYSRKAAA